MVENIYVPIVIAIFLICAIFYSSKLIFNIFRFNTVYIKIIFTIIVWYFVGPLMYNWLDEMLITINYDWIRIIYMPIHYIIQLF